MLKGINQTMVNRYIARGDNCRCIGGNGISGGSNGGKIEIEFTAYETEDDDKIYIKKDEADGIFNKILNMDIEKHRFYLVDILSLYIGIEYSEHTIHSCEYLYRRRKTIEDSKPKEYQFVQIYYEDETNNEHIKVIGVNLLNDVINYTSSSIYGITDIVETIPDTATILKTFKIILYYMEY